MSKSISPQMLALYNSGSQRFVRCWKITRTDGQVFGFTEFNKSLLFEGLMYEAPIGFTPNNEASEADLSVPNSQILGLLHFASITDEDLLGGVWDSSTFEQFEVDPEQRSAGDMIISAGTIGTIESGLVSFTSETRGISQKLQQTSGRVYASPCDTELGSPYCKVDLAPLMRTGAVTQVTNKGQFQSDTSEVNDYFGNGWIVWTSGLNEGRRMEVRLYTNANGEFTLHQSMVEAIQIGDTFEAAPGCRHRMNEDCRDKFDNIINFQGFDLPMNDVVLGYGAVNSA